MAAASAAIQQLVELAKQLGIDHLVLLSGRGEAGAQRAEKIVQDSGLNWNVVRASWFAQNFSESFMLDGILAGQLALPADQVLEPFVDADDIADVVVATLTNPALQRQIFEVSGPRALRFSDCVHAISQACGRPIQYRPIPLAPFLQALARSGASQEMRGLMAELFGEVLDGRNSHIANGVEQALGRPAADFSDYIAKTLASGVWTPAIPATAD